MAEDEINKKVINIFNRHNNDLPVETEEKIKFFAGYNYVKIKTVKSLMNKAFLLMQKNVIIL